ncbi:hypothetical protein V6N13_049689 [Hibiscus sabdariffa]
MIPLASLKMESSGRVVLQVQSTTAVWSTNRTATAQNPVLQLLDAGNVVGSVRNGPKDGTHRITLDVY